MNKINRENNPENWSGFYLMRRMIGLVKPLWKEMIAAISAGVLGFLMSFGLGILGAYMLLSFLKANVSGLDKIPLGGLNLETFVTLLIVAAVSRGLLHYIEQFFNHLIAFKILAIIRNKVFAALRRLAPAKLDSKDDGQLISMIMGDIELLEVFYAHTISPISIAIITALILLGFYVSINPLLAIIPLVSQICVGVVFPLIASKKAKASANKVRAEIGDLNTEFLDKLSGIKELIQYGAVDNAISNVKGTTASVLKRQKVLGSQMSALSAWIDTAIIAFSTLQAVFAYALYQSSTISAAAAMISTVLTLSSFGPFINLANLGNTLSKTFACGRRVLGLLDEKPIVEPVANGNGNPFTGIHCKELSFSYGDDSPNVLKSVDLSVERKEILGIKGDSGSGKSTLLKLLMRFWDANSGEIKISGLPIDQIDTNKLYDNFNYMTQSTMLFTGSIRDNLSIAKPDATDEELDAALKKAAIYDYVNQLENKIDTQVNELGSNFSGGERQRLGLARCFLADRPVYLLDEPTSNLDSLNEAMILKSLVSESSDKTVIFVSHRLSTLGVCRRVLEMKDGELEKQVGYTA